MLNNLSILAIFEYKGYRHINDPYFNRFVVTKLTRQAKKAFGVKVPWFGQNRGKVLIRNDAYPSLILLYSTMRGNIKFMSGNSKLDAVKTNIPK